MRNSSRTWLERANRTFAGSIPPNALVLDAGAGDQPYRKLLSHCRYEAADFELVDKSYAKSTYVCDLSTIPVEDGRFDAILFNQTLEHLPEPLAVLKELHRVLKPGGKMICTAPLFYEEHEQPYDFYRYTQFGWRHLMTAANFTILSLEWMEGYFGTVAYQLQTAARYLPSRPGKDGLSGVRGYALWPLLLALRVQFHVLARLFYRLDEHTKVASRGFPKNYVVIVQKPDGD